MKVEQLKGDKDGITIRRRRCLFPVDGIDEKFSEYINAEQNQQNIERITKQFEMAQNRMKAVQKFEVEFERTLEIMQKEGQIDPMLSLLKTELVKLV